MIQMKCPYCGTQKTLVKETVDLVEQIGRRRYCPACHRYFYTLEQLSEMSVLKDGYSRDRAQK